MGFHVLALVVAFLAMACLKPGDSGPLDSGDTTWEADADADADSDTDTDADGDTDTDTDADADTDADTDADADADTDTDADADTDTDTDTDPTFATLWSSTEFELVISGGKGDYHFGYMETLCLEDWPPELCWSAEDCYRGYGSYAWCHPAAATGLVLAGVASPSEVVEGSTTLMTASESWPDGITYYVREDATERCWVWGHQVRYYEDLGCTEI